MLSIFHVIESLTDFQRHSILFTLEEHIVKLIVSYLIAEEAVWKILCETNNLFFATEVLLRAVKL
jgi:hypothetical protein